jgi:hypothetical protein
MPKIFFCFLLIPFFICNIALKCTAQADLHIPSKYYRYALYAGAGPNYYFNNLVLAKDYVNVYNFCFSARLMWEGEYKLSVGIESGYNRLYSMDIDFGNSNGSVHIDNTAIPLQLLVSMKFFEDFYASFTFGPSILQNHVRSTEYGDFSASTLSYADFAFTIGHRQLFKKRFYLGTELKVFYSSRLNDRNLSLLFMGGYRF